MQTSQESYKDISLSPSSADRIAVFVGELNGNIKLIEKTFSVKIFHKGDNIKICLLYTSPSPRDAHESRMPSSA